VTGTLEGAVRKLVTCLAGVLLLLIVGCGQQIPTATPEPTAIPTPTAAPDPPRYWQAQYEQAQGIPPTGRTSRDEYLSGLFPEFAAEHIVGQEALRHAAASVGTTPELTTFADALPTLTVLLPGASTWRALRAMTQEQRWVMYERYAELGQTYVRGLAMSVLAGSEPALTFQATDLALAGGAATITQLMVEKAAFMGQMRGYYPAWMATQVARNEFSPAAIRTWEITAPALAGTETYMDALDRKYDLP